MRYGGFWRRVAAYIIDSIVVGIPIGILQAVLHGTSGRAIAEAIGLIGGWLYFSLMESSTRQATLGKMALDMKVTDLEGNRISFGRATGRYFAKILSFIIIFIGVIMVAFTERKQGLHDKIAGTLVPIAATAVALVTV